MNELRIYGASDDCIEFEGAFREEYYIRDGHNTFRVRVDDGVTATFLEVTVEWERAWEISVRTITGLCDITVPVLFTQRGYADDPAVVLQLPEGTTVEVTRL